MANGKQEKVESIYRKMARINGLQISEEAIGAFKDLNMVKTEKVRGIDNFYYILNEIELN